MPIVRRNPFGAFRSCCSSGPALGQLDEGTIAATTAAVGAPEIVIPPGERMPWRGLFAVSVGAGLTVWALTKWLGKKTT